MKRLLTTLFAAGAFAAIAKAVKARTPAGAAKAASKPDLRHPERQTETMERAAGEPVRP
jgi:hypothetical protein